MSSQDKARLGSAQKLKLFDTVAQSVGLMGPVFSVAFLVPLLVGITSATGQGAGGAAPFSVIIAGAGVLGFGWIIAQYSKKIHSAGSLYDYVTDGLGVRLGAAAGWLYYAGILALGAGILPMIGGTIHDTVLSEFNKAPLPYWGWDLILFAVVAVVLFVGVAVSTRLQLIMAMLSVTVVFIFSVVIIVRSHEIHHIAKAFSPSSSPQGWHGILFGVLYGVLLFTGFETSANLGEETENPKRDIPRAVLFSVLAVGGFYVLGTFAQVAGFHFNLGNLGKDASGPLFALAGPTSMGGYGSVAVRRLIELVVILDMTAVLIGCAVAASRGLFALGRDGRLPGALGKISKRGTPSSGSVAVLVVYAVTMYLALNTHIWALPGGTPQYVNVFNIFSTFGGFALVIVYLAMSVGAFFGLRGHEKPWAVWIAAVAGILVTGGAIFGAIYKVAAPTIYAPWAGLAVLVVGLVAAFSMKLRPASSQVLDELTESERGPLKL